MENEMLGLWAKDRITGFEGRIVGYVEYISGCNQALVQPKVDKDGKIPDSIWFDVQRLETQSKGRISLDNSKTPGPDRPAPHR